MRKKKKDEFKFSDKYHPLQGIIGVILAFVVLIAMSILFYISSTSEGNAGIWIGLVGLGMFVINIIGFVLSVLAFHKQEIYYRFPIAGILLNGCFLIVFLLLYIVGI
ncbi:DUF6142 family protein [Anaerosporobacter sp.]